MTTKDSRLRSFRTWYDRNRDEFNERRRNRYQSDPEYRAKVKESARSQRRSLDPDPAPPVYREVGGRSVRVYRAGEAAEMARLAPQTLRRWSANEVIPGSTFPGKHRLYTRNQVKLIAGVAYVAARYRYDYATLRPEMAKASEKAFNNWTK